MGLMPATPTARSMTEGQTSTVWGAWIGLAGILLSAAAGGIELLLTQPWPNGADPVFPDFLRDNRDPLLAQSMLFVVGAAASIWFLGFIRARLQNAEGPPGAVSAIGFGAGLITYGMIIVAQAAQITLMLPSETSVLPEVAFVVEGLCTVTTALANFPAAVMFAAVAALSFSRRAFPEWLGWIAVLCAITSLLSGFAVVPAEGPLSPTGWLTNIARLVPILFYVPAALLLMSKRGRAD